jgi:hypothetical protein
MYGNTAVESVEEDFEVGIRLEETFDQGEVEYFFKHGDVIVDGVNDFNSQISICLGSNFGKVDLLLI